MNKINIGLIGYGTVGSGVVRLLRQRKAFIKKKFGKDLIVKYKKGSPPTRLVFNTKKAKKLLGFEPRITLEKGIEFFGD